MKRVLFYSLLVVSCSKAPAEKHESPAHVQGAVQESSLAQVHLTAEARKTLAIEVATVENRQSSTVSKLGGEVSIPPGRTLTITAPIPGVVRITGELAPGSPVKLGQALMTIVPLAPVSRGATAEARRAVQAAEATLTAADARLTRTQELAKGSAASQRAIEEATAARDVATADLAAANDLARNVRRTPLLSDEAMRINAPEEGVISAVSIGSGQLVHAGAPLVEVVAAEALWVRIPIPSSDLSRLNLGETAMVVGAARQDAATPVPCPPAAGPPSSDPLRGTVDHYCALEGSSPLFRPGARVIAELPLKDRAPHPAVPASSIFYDPTGSSWVYVCDDELTFHRARIDILGAADGWTALRSGPQVGTCVVSTGAAELYGAEFEPGH